MLPLSLAASVIATVLLLLHVARRYPGSPKNVPIGLRLDGRPRRPAPKLVLWLAPVILATTVALTGAMTFIEPVPPEGRATMTLVFLIFAEIAALVAWATDRQIELGRKQIFRVAPSRTLLVAFPLLATIAILIALAARSGAS